MRAAEGGTDGSTRPRFDRRGRWLAAAREGRGGVRRRRRRKCATALGDRCELRGGARRLRRRPLADQGRAASCSEVPGMSLAPLARRRRCRLARRRPPLAANGHTAARQLLRGAHARSSTPRRAGTAEARVRGRRCQPGGGGGRGGDEAPTTCLEARLLLEAGVAAVDALEDERRRRRHAAHELAPDQGADALEAARLLLEKGAAVDAKDEDGTTALMIACQMRARGGGAAAAREGRRPLAAHAVRPHRPRGPQRACSLDRGGWRSCARSSQ